MIVVRDIFRLKFGQAKPATDAWRQALPLLKKHAPKSSSRLLTDLAGTSYYTIVFETTFDSLQAWEDMHKSAKTDAAWKKVYEQIVPHTEEGRREILSVIE